MAGSVGKFASISCTPCAPSWGCHQPSQDHPRAWNAGQPSCSPSPRPAGYRGHSAWKERGPAITCGAYSQDQGEKDVGEKAYNSQLVLLRRHALAAASAVALGISLPDRAEAVQGMTAGRLPGLGPEAEDGYRKYTRPEGKSGGHGVGWTEFDPYSFRIPEGWQEVPVSIADLGGTEIDLRFSSQQGNISVVVAPILRFADLGESPTIDQIGSPDKVINAFGPEVIGQVVDDKVVYARAETKEDRKLYYQFELSNPHVLITATAASNRLYLFNVSATTRQWKKSEASLRKIADSFRVAKRA